MATTMAIVPTENGSRYLQQLCKHWSHKFEVEFDAEKGRIELPGVTATMVAQPDALVVTLEGESADDVERLKDVVSSHVDRFAFREAPLPFEWRD